MKLISLVAAVLVSLTLSGCSQSTGLIVDDKLSREIETVRPTIINGVGVGLRTIRRER